VVLNSAIRVATMMMGMRSIPSVGPISQGRVSFGHMRGVLAE
jgi:hypothetical protein